MHLQYIFVFICFIYNLKKKLNYDDAFNVLIMYFDTIKFEIFILSFKSISLLIWPKRSITKTITFLLVMPTSCL